MIFEYMKNHAAEFEIQQVANTLKISRSGYYKHVHKKISEQVAIDAVLTNKIKTAFEQNRRAYGSPRIHRELKKQGMVCSRKKLLCL